MHTLRPFARVTLLSLVLAAACRAPSVPHPVLTGCHPACPGARTAAVGDAGTNLRGAPPQPPASEAGGELAPSALAYLCPMHLHVGSAEPGRCPECNMKLVPRAQALEHDHGN